MADGIWALVSDPLIDRTTLCNGGIVAGRSGVVVVEGFGSDEGARWIMRQARELVLERNRDAPEAALEGARIRDQPRPTEIDLGGGSLVVVPRRGHTDSDVTVEVSEPRVVFAGDLVWSGMFPNYMDATPSRLSREIALR